MNYLGQKIRQKTIENKIKQLDNDVIRYKAVQRKYSNDSNVSNRIAAALIPMAIAQTKLEKRMWQLELSRGRK
uniref:hypothetical protein n=1 Tax=Lactobacillus acidophilus TaxID=1579 RepID=UPI003F56F74F